LEVFIEFSSAAAEKIPFLAEAFPAVTSSAAVSVEAAAIYVDAAVVDLAFVPTDTVFLDLVDFLTFFFATDLRYIANLASAALVTSFVATAIRAVK
jgi:hypothetical protein